MEVIPRCLLPRLPELTCASQEWGEGGAQTGTVMPTHLLLEQHPGPQESCEHLVMEQTKSSYSQLNAPGDQYGFVFLRLALVFFLMWDLIIQNICPLSAYPAGFFVVS